MRKMEDTNKPKYSKYAKLIYSTGEEKAHREMVKKMPDVFKRERERETQKGKNGSKYNTAVWAKGKKKMREINGKELQLIRGNWF